MGKGENKQGDDTKCWSRNPRWAFSSLWTSLTPTQLSGYEPGRRGTGFVSVRFHCRVLTQDQASPLNWIAFSLMVGFFTVAGVTRHPQAWHVQVPPLPPWTFPVPAPSSSCSFPVSGCWGFNLFFLLSFSDFFPFPFLPPFSVPSPFPSRLAFVVFRLKPRGAPLAFPGQDTGRCLSHPRACLHPPLGTVASKGPYILTLYSVAQNSFVYCRKSYQLMCMSIYKLLSPALQLVAVGNREKL